MTVIYASVANVCNTNRHYPLSLPHSLFKACLRWFQETLPDYQPTRSSWSTTPSVDSQMRELPSDETPRMINVFPFQGANQRLPEQVIRAQFPTMAREEPAFRHRARIRSPIFKEEDRRSTECHAGGSTVSGNPTSHRTRPSSNAHQSSPGSYIFSPVPSLFRARARALAITGLSRGGTDGDRSQGVPGDGYLNGDGTRRNFRSYESPFSWRVKEKLRETHISNSEVSGGPSPQAMDLLASDEDAHRYGSPEISGADLINCHINVIVGLNMTGFRCQNARLIHRGRRISGMQLLHLHRARNCP